MFSGNESPRTDDGLEVAATQPRMGLEVSEHVAQRGRGSSLATWWSRVLSPWDRGPLARLTSGRRARPKKIRVFAIRNEPSHTTSNAPATRAHALMRPTAHIIIRHSTAGYQRPASGNQSIAEATELLLIWLLLSTSRWLGRHLNGDLHHAVVHTLRDDVARMLVPYTRSSTGRLGLDPWRSPREHTRQKNHGYGDTPVCAQA